VHILGGSRPVLKKGGRSRSLPYAEIRGRNAGPTLYRPCRLCERSPSQQDGLEWSPRPVCDTLCLSDSVASRSVSFHETEHASARAGGALARSFWIDDGMRLLSSARALRCRSSRPIRARLLCRPSDPSSCRSRCAEVAETTTPACSACGAKDYGKRPSCAKNTRGWQFRAATRGSPSSSKRGRDQPSCARNLYGLLIEILGFSYRLTGPEPDHNCLRPASNDRGPIVYRRKSVHVEWR
jgi:hypothetical protein